MPGDPLRVFYSCSSRRRAFAASPALTLVNCQLLIANCSVSSASFCVNLRQPVLLFPLFLCDLCVLCG
jgi:hypothetical protein